MSSTNIDIEKFNHKRTNQVEVKQQYQVKISNSFAALGDDDDDDDDVDINRVRESIRQNTKPSATDSLGYYELKQHKPCFGKVLKITRSK
jgi:phosphoglycolate phosphatase-like HAD superfamily hydrolase